MKCVSILGSTGSIGRQSLDVVEQLHIPVCLDRIHHEFSAAQSLENDRVKILDARWNPDDPILRQVGDRLDAEVAGWFQVLYQDENNQIQLANLKASDTVSFASDPRNDLQINLRGSHSPEIVNSGAGTVLRTEGVLAADVFAEQKLEMVTGMELGAGAKPDPQRPSLILRRVADEDLWKIAKEHGSTVDAIRDANRLEGEPESGRILLIPVP